MTLGTVLVVDDEPILCELVGQILGCHQFRSLTAFDGGSGLAAALQQRPDVIILDVMLPDIDGFEVCRRLRSAPATASIPVLILTSLTSAYDRAQALAAGADEFLSKPFRADELIRIVRALSTPRNGHESPGGDNGPAAATDSP